MSLTAKSSPGQLTPGASRPTPTARFAGIDRLRGLAILLMIGDHLALAVGSDLYRFTLGRAAMPLFFVLGGYLLTRFTTRHALVGVLGVLLPLAAPWVDNPNVLVWYAVGAFLLTRSWARHPATLAGVALAGLMLAANGYAELIGHGYNGVALLGIMALGGLLRSVGPVPGPFRAADRLPGWLALLGRFPLSWYVGHVLFLTATAAIVHGLRS